MDWYCPRCGREDETSDEVVALFHRCRRPHYLRPPTRDLEQDRVDWARRLLGDALADALDRRDPTALLRSIEEESA